MQPADVRLQHRLLAELQDVLLHLLLRLGDDLLDARRVDAAVLDQLGQREPGGLAADVVERADDDHAGRVVDDHVDAGGLLEGADVPPFAADDPALHVVARDVDRADGGVGGVLGGVALDGGGEDLAGLLLGLLLQRAPRAAGCGAAISSASSRSSRSSSIFSACLARQAGDLVQPLRLLLDQLRRAASPSSPACSLRSAIFFLSASRCFSLRASSFCFCSAASSRFSARRSVSPYRIHAQPIPSLDALSRSSRFS